MRIHLPRTLVLIFLLIAITLAWLRRTQLTTEAAAAWVGQSGMWGPAVFIGIYAIVPALFLPGSVLTFAAGVLFGPFIGALLSVIGATIGATVAFLIARYVAAEWVERRVSGRFQEIKEGSKEKGGASSPSYDWYRFFPFNLLNYALGLTRLSVQTFALTSFVTMAPGAFAYAYLGDASREAVGGGPELVRKGLLALALLAIVTLLPSFIRRWRQSEKMSPQHLQTLLSQGESLIVLDVRNPEEFLGDRGHIPGAVLCPVPEIATKLKELKVHRAQPIITV